MTTSSSMRVNALERDMVRDSGFVGVRGECRTPRKRWIVLSMA